MTTYQPSEDKEIYKKCIGIARIVSNFIFTIEGDKVCLSSGNPPVKQRMDKALFFQLDTNEIINLLQKKGSTHE